MKSFKVNPTFQAVYLHYIPYGVYAISGEGAVVTASGYSRLFLWIHHYLRSIEPGIYTFYIVNNEMGPETNQGRTERVSASPSFCQVNTLCQRDFTARV